MFEQVLQQIAVVAVFVERAVQLVKSLVPYEKWAAGYQAYIDQALVIVGSAALCYAWHVDVFAVAGIVVSQAAWLGSVLTGVLAGLGGNVIHELIELLKMWRQGLGVK